MRSPEAMEHKAFFFKKQIFLMVSGWLPPNMCMTRLNEGLILPLVKQPTWSTSLASLPLGPQQLTGDRNNILDHFISLVEK